MGKEIEVAVEEVVNYLRITGRFAPALRAVVERSVAKAAAKTAGLRVTTKELQRGADVFRQTRDLAKANDMRRWLKANGISAEAFEKHIETNLLISKFKDALLKKAKPAKCLASPVIGASIRELAYHDWLAVALR